MSGLRSVAWYRPGHRAGGLPVSGPDEDAFTLAAEAIERSAEQARAPDGVARLVLFGAVPSELDWAFPVLLGYPVEIRHERANPRTLLEAIDRENDDGAPASLVVAVEYSPDSATSEVGSITGTSGEGAVAFRLGPGGSPIEGSVRDRAASSGSVLDAAFALWPPLAETAPVDRSTGDGPVARGPAEPPRAPELGAGTGPVLSAVSEGAYVPRPRYLENLPSRWRLRAERCDACGSLTFPARGRCRSCQRSDRLRFEELPRRGARVIASTVIGPGGQPTEFDFQVARSGAYQVVLAELSPEARITLPVTDGTPGGVRIGDRVDTSIRRLFPMEGEWRYGRKAVPLRTHDPTSF